GTGVSGNNFNPMGLSGTIVLTFTPDAGQCANNTEAYIFVTTPVTPVITGVPTNMCQNAPPINLNTIPDGISGNWSGMGVTSNIFNPAGLSGDIILTFTPDPGQCAT